MRSRACRSPRGWSRGFPALVRAAQARGARVAVLTCDIDHFKSVNDTHGHVRGDRVLKAFRGGLGGDGARRRLRLPVGGGGVRLATLVPHEPAARQAAERLPSASPSRVRRAAADRSRSRVARGAGHGLREAFDAADAALYRAKALGRNRVVLCQRCGRGRSHRAAAARSSRRPERLAPSAPRAKSAWGRAIARVPLGVLAAWRGRGRGGGGVAGCGTSRPSPMSVSRPSRPSRRSRTRLESVPGAALRRSRRRRRSRVRSRKAKTSASSQVPASIRVCAAPRSSRAMSTTSPPRIPGAERVGRRRSENVPAPIAASRRARDRGVDGHARGTRRLSGASLPRLRSRKLPASTDDESMSRTEPIWPGFRAVGCRPSRVGGGGRSGSSGRLRVERGASSST